MNLSYALFVLSGVIFIIAFIPYTLAILRKETRPRKVTWLIWFVGDLIVLLGMVAKHTINGIIIVAVVGAGSTLALSIKQGERGWTKHDKYCLSLSGLAIALWIYFGDSNLGICFSLLSLAIAAWPTYVSASRNPEIEDRRSWILFNLSSFVALWAIPRGTFADIAPPVTFMAIDGVMLYLLFVHQRLKRYVIARQALR